MARCSTGFTNPCPNGIIDTECVIYTGSNLPCIGIETNNRLADILPKLETAICNSAGSNIFSNNWLTRTGAYIQFGGPLAKNTSIDFNTFDVNISNLLEDNDSTFVQTVDSSGNWKKMSLDQFVLGDIATSLPSSEAINGLNYTYDSINKHYTFKLGGVLTEDTSIDLSTFNLSLLNIPSTGADVGLALDSSGNIVTSTLGQSYEFQNGLTNTSGTVELGGTLLHDTLIDQDNNDIRFDNGNVGFNLATAPTRTITIGDSVNGVSTGTIYCPDGTDFRIEATSGATGIGIRANSNVAIYPFNDGSSGNVIFGKAGNMGLETYYLSNGIGSPLGIIGLNQEAATFNEMFLRVNDQDVTPGYISLYNKIKFRNVPARSTNTKIISIDVDENVRVITGVSGSFTSQDGKSITVIDGIITSIV